MNNTSPLVPQGSLLEQKNKGRARVKIAVFFVLTIHGIGLMALLLQGCRHDPSEKTEQATTQAMPTLETGAQVADANNTNTTPTVPGALGNTAQPGSTDNTGPAASTIGGGEYTIAKGDTFSSIATHYHVTTKALMDANPNVDAKSLQIGKKLHIPAQPLPSPQTTVGGNTTPEPSNGEKLYTVKSGDTLSTIAKSHSTSIKALRTANNLSTDRITVGQKLKIPVKPVETAASSPPPAAR